MTGERSPALDPAAVTTLLCDADGTLFPSEEPAYAASADVTNRFNFRAAAGALATSHRREITR